MPRIKSKAQRRKFAELLVEGKISPETFEEWNRGAGKARLPERVTPKAKAKAKRKAKPKRKTTTRPPVPRRRSVPRKSGADWLCTKIERRRYGSVFDSTSDTCGCAEALRTRSTLRYTMPTAAR